MTTGLNEDGRSTVISDEPGVLLLDGPFVKVFNLWETNDFPIAITDEFGPQLHDGFEPDSGMRVYRTLIAPDESWNADPDTRAEALNTGADFHQTATVDIQTVLSGEVHAVLEEREVVLRAGDSIVTRGVPHTWRNRSSQVAVLLAVMISAATS
ncbi:cupin domain-containing protein [Sciscionella sediminilitoris]|uniref:cupin domain-containing protein n=1 Tax=Sciscionella sediminilitoris TaxID=1445613 RepID=UPI0018D0C04C|nr:cupin domain-containing protein [Sciscionella sp. SE31]